MWHLVAGRFLLPKTPLIPGSGSRGTYLRLARPTCAKYPNSSTSSSSVKRHAVALAAGPIGDSFVPEGKVASERVVFGKPLRDSGCRRIRIAFVVAPSGPVSMGRTCERFRRAPPSYASRPLPSTATGDTNTLVRVGAIGGFAGPLFSGFVIDRFGDVYDAHDYPGPYNVEPPAFVGDCIETLPPAEVEQFAFDASLVASEREEPESVSAHEAPDQSTPVVQAFVGPERKTINLPAISARAARRATRWARESANRRRE